MKIEPKTGDGARWQRSSVAEASQQLASDVGSVISGREGGKGGGCTQWTDLLLQMAMVTSPAPVLASLLSVCRSCSSPSPAPSIPPRPFPLGRDASTVQSTVSCPSDFVLHHRSICLLITRASTTRILLHT